MFLIVIGLGSLPCRDALVLLAVEFVITSNESATRSCNGNIGNRQHFIDTLNIMRTGRSIRLQGQQR